MSALVSFLAGGVMFGSAVCGTFFLKAWRKTRDRFFGLFALAFYLLAIERIVREIMRTQREGEQPLVFLFRLAAFVIILVAIADKNRAAP